MFDFKKSARDKFSEATECLQNQQNEKALEIFDEILEEEPDFIHAINGKGSALMQMGRLDEAEEVFNHSLEVAESEMAYLNKSIISRKNEDYENALKYCDRAAELQPSLKDLTAGLKHDILKEMGDNSTADMSQFSDEISNLIKEGRSLKAEGKLWDGLDKFESAIKKNSDCKEIVVPLINEIKDILLRQFLFFDISQKENFGKSEIDQFKIRILKAIMIDEDPTLAMITVNQALDIDGDDLDVLNYQGALLFYFDENEKAIECFDKCLSINEDYIFALFNKGMVLRRMWKLPEALDVFDELLKIPNAYDKVKPYQREILDKLEDFMGVKLY